VDEIPSQEPTHLRRGTPDYRQTSLVLFVAGFMAFAMLYVAQGILPDLSRDFTVSPATASLTLSLTTLPLAIAVLVAASWSEGQGRRRLLVGAVLSAAVLTLVASIAPSFEVLLALRVLTGLCLAGLPAVAMAYVAEEFHPSGLGTAMGLYISGTGLGGMTGRLAGGLLASTWSWRVAMAAVGGVCLVGGVWVALRLPSSRNFVATPGTLRERMVGLKGPLRDPVILRFALCGFVLMGSLVSFYNYLQYRLVKAPFDLSPTVVALVFLLYLFGTVSANWMGALTDRRSRRSVLMLGMAIMAAGALLTLSNFLPLVLLGASMMVFGFFGGHSVTSGWVSGWATQQRAQSSALYLFGYHIGSSVAGFVGGIFYVMFGWPGEIGTVLVLLAVGLVVALSLPAGKSHAPVAEPK
jgi:YNFM family putative membrane transporter